MAPDQALTAGNHLPEDWLIGMTCPVCGDTKLAIDRELGRPDQMACKTCLTSFEVSQDGAWLRLVRYPDHLPAELKNSWLKPAAIAGIAQNFAHLNNPGQPASALELPVADRIRKLASLGNSPGKIREILLRQPGLQPEQVDEALSKFYIQKKSKGSAAWQWILAGVAIILAIAVIVALFLQPAPQSKPKNAGAPVGNPATPASSNSYMDPALLPGPLQTLIPSGARILKPTPVVVHSLNPANQPSVRCPRSQGEAAQAFGGEMKEWTQSNTGAAGWYMVSPQSRTIHVPKNMTGGYFVVSPSMAIESVMGPAELENVNFIAISCE